MLQYDMAKRTMDREQFWDFIENMSNITGVYSSDDELGPVYLRSDRKSMEALFSIVGSIDPELAKDVSASWNAFFDNLEQKSPSLILVRCTQKEVADMFMAVYDSGAIESTGGRRTTVRVIDFEERLKAKLQQDSEELLQ